MNKGMVSNKTRNKKYLEMVSLPRFFNDLFGLNTTTQVVVKNKKNRK